MALAESPDIDDRSWLDAAADRRVAEARSRGDHPDAPFTDADLQTAVHRALTHDRLLDAHKIVVLVEGGVVTLQGMVAGASDRVLADILAHDVAGVDQVWNHLLLRPEEFPPPAAARQAPVEQHPEASATFCP